MSEDDEFDTPQYRMKTVESPNRTVQLRPHTPTFGFPPRTDSYQSLNLSVSFSENLPSIDNLQMPPRVKSTTDILEMMNDSTTNNISSLSSISEPVDPEKVKNELKKLYQGPSPFIESITDKAAHLKNQIIIDKLDQTHFLPLSAILQSHVGKRALIVIPSTKISQWIRSFIVDSSALCPEGRSQQQKVLNQLSGGRTQVLLCIANRLSTLPLTIFDVIFVVKAELVEESLYPLYNYDKLLIIHQSPGFPILESFQSICETSQNPDLQPRCVPTAVFVDDYLDALYDSIDTDEKTVVIAPFKTVIDKVFKKIHKKSIKYSGNWSTTEVRACVSTTAVFFTNAIFDHYIFVDYPPSLSYLLMALYFGKKVTVFVNNQTALRLQSYSHNRGVDLSIVQKIVQSIFWSGSNYRKVNDICSITLSGVDINTESFNDLCAEMVLRKLIKIIPFNHQTLNIRIQSLHQKSSLLTTIAQNRSNSHGFYNVPMISICNQLNESPMQIEKELEKLEGQKVIQYKFVENAYFFQIMKEFDDDDIFMESVREISSKLLAVEVKRDHEFDLLYTYLKNPESIPVEDIIQRKELEQIDAIPHLPVNIQNIKKLLTNSRRSDWTPRSVSRIVHGLSSPLFSRDEWSRTTYWNQQADSSFKEVMAVCQSVACNPNKLIE